MISVYRYFFVFAALTMNPLQEMEFCRAMENVTEDVREILDTTKIQKALMSITSIRTSIY